VHLDKNFAFTGASTVAHTFRHEVAHIYGYGRGNPNQTQAQNDSSDAVADSVATACGG